MDKRALVIEGGGMKSAYGNGVLSAFEEAGHTEWDAVYGTSAGGAMAAWYSAGQARYAEKTWDYAADPRILSYGRWARFKGPLLDHEALLEIVYLKEHPLDQEAIRRCKHPVVVTAADVHSGEVVYHDLRQGDIIAWLKATGRLPFASGPTVAIDGREFLDGGVLDPIPIRRAVADGATDVTLILNKPPGKRQRDNAVLAGMAARRYPKLRDGILRHHAIKGEALDYAESPPVGVKVRIIRPTKPTGLSRLSRDLKLIRAAIEQGRSDGHAFLQSVTATKTN
ncbi:MAG TPA: patatin family protein [Candidatus Thermoplasmatota archaeon]|nr:patatin family protein [Candidatus Thermoplasmatota archaeon]